MSADRPSTADRPRATEGPGVGDLAPRRHEMLCVADVDTRLTCSTYCAVCLHYVRERRVGERRKVHRPTHDRRILGRL